MQPIDPKGFQSCQRRFSVYDPTIIDNIHIRGALVRALARYRERRHFSRDMLASLIGVPVADVAKWETSSSPQPPAADVLIRWLEHFGFSRVEWRDDGYNVVGDLYGSHDDIPEDISVRLYTSQGKRFTYV